MMRIEHQSNMATVKFNDKELTDASIICVNYVEPHQ